ncbi:MAG: DUF4389 domain-containing protein [Acidobacteriota bacterium]
MSTPPGDDQAGGTPPPDSQWSWEPRTFGDPAPPPPSQPDPFLPPPAEPLVVPEVPAQGLAWDSADVAAEPGGSSAEEAASEPVGAAVSVPAAEAAEGSWALAVPTAAALPPDPVSPPPPQYPTRFDVAYPPALSRWKTLLRLVLAIPLMVTATLVTYLIYMGLLIGWTTVFWRKKYPDWLFRGVGGAMGYIARTFAYISLLTDKYPSFSQEDNPVTLEFDPPPSGQLSRWRVLFWKYLLLLPMGVVLSFLALAGFVVTVLAWFAILFTGHYPRGLFQFSVGIQRWHWRMYSYMASFNDRYPPYALSESAGPGSNSSVVINGIFGAVIVAIYGVIIIAAVVAGGKHVTQNVNYDQLKAGRAQVTTTFSPTLQDRDHNSVLVRLSRAVDPGDSLIQVIRPASDQRIIVFQWTVVNGSSGSQLIAGDVARLKYSYDDGGETKTKSIDAQIVGVNNVTAPANLDRGSTATVQAVFIVPEDAEPTELWFHHGFANGGVKYQFR